MKPMAAVQRGDAASRMGPDLLPIPGYLVGDLNPGTDHRVSTDGCEC